MRRALLLLLGISAVTWLEYDFFPGHTYLQADSQIYLPILERLDTPGFLSRDLVATHPNVAFTIYDEITLALHEAGLNFKTALSAQQILFRAAAFIGIFLLALSAGISDLPAFLIAALLNLGAVLTGPAVLLVEYEPVPRAFAFGLILLAIGLIAREKPLLGGLAGGLAMVYNPPIAAPFWGVAIVAFAFDRNMRRLLKPALTVLAVFVLLLANLAQLQPGVIEPQVLFGRISDAFAALQQYRTGFAWVSLWAPREIWHYLAIAVLELWATARIWPVLNRPARWLFVALPLCGIASIPVSDILLEHLRWSIIPQIEPAQALLFTVAFASVACGIAGVRAAASRRHWETLLWFVVVFALPMNVRILDLLSFHGSNNEIQLGLAFGLAGLLALLLTIFSRTKWRAAVLVVLPIAIFAIPGIGRAETYAKIDKQPILEVAAWATKNTWGSSMFLFPDAGKAIYPGIFRAESRRALWVDWESGGLVAYFESFAAEWWDRWQETMQDGFSPQRLQNMLALPIDYYVLKRTDRLGDIKPVFANRNFVVYDAEDLKNARPPLHLAANPYLNY